MRVRHGALGGEHNAYCYIWQTGKVIFRGSFAPKSMAYLNRPFIPLHEINLTYSLAYTYKGNY